MPLKPLNRAQAAAFLRETPLDTQIHCRIYELSFAGQFQSEPDQEPYMLRRIEPYLTNDLDLFLRESLTAGCIDSAARMTALFSRSEVTLSGHRVVKDRHVWRVRATMNVALADPAFDAAAWARGAPATLADVAGDSQFYNRKERWVPMGLLGPMKVTARKTQRVLELRSVTLKVAL